MNVKHEDHLSRVRSLTKGTILIENLSLSFWPLLFWVLLITALVLLQIPSWLGSAGKTGVFYTFWLGSALLFVRGALLFRWPSQREIDRRIEHRNQYEHTPLSTLEDELANPDKRDTRLLWMDAQEKIRALIFGARADRPRAFMAGKDPYALRYFIALLFVAGALIAGNDGRNRIEDSLSPKNFRIAAGQSNDVKVWIEPPAYTGLPQIVPAKNTLLEIPMGSVLKASVQGGFTKPVLKIGKKAIPFKKSGDKNYGVEAEISMPGKIIILQQHLRRAAWDYNLIRDTEPQIIKAGEAEAGDDGTLRFALNVKDDYGIATLTMRMTLGQSMNEMPRGKPLEETRIVTSPPKQEIEINPLYDLSGHTWAGLPVHIAFEVTDAAGHKAILNPQLVTLPVRQFAHPVAQEIARIRKGLIDTKDPDTLVAARELETLLMRPYYFQDDFIAFMGLRSASSRLLWSPPTEETLISVIDLLWNVALQVEDGNLSTAQMNLRDAKSALEKALADPNTAPEEIARLMDDMRQAMNEYLMQLQQNLAKKMAHGGQIMQVPASLMEQLLNPGSLAAMLDQLQADMQSGNRQAAQDMLSKLGQMMDVLNPSLVQKIPEDVRIMGEAMNILQQIIEAEQDVLDSTRLLNDEEFATTEKKLQIEIKDALEKLTAGLKTLPQKPLDSLQSAWEEMGLAADNLDRKKAPLAVPHQERSLEHLKKAKEQLGQQLNARLKQMTGISFGNNGMRFDPLGRPMQGDNGRFLDSNVKIPDASERRQAQEILDLLRERSGEDRPEVELEYYRRLLKLF